MHPISQLVSPADIITEMKKSGVRSCVLLAMDLDPSVLNTRQFLKSLDSLLSYSHIFDTKGLIENMYFILEHANTPNSYVSELVELNSEFIGFGSVNLGYKSKKYVKNKLNEILKLNFRGIKVLPTLQFFDPRTSKTLPDVFKFAEKNDLIILYHTGCDPGPWEMPLLSKNGNPKYIETLIRRYPKVQVILAHLGSYSGLNPGIWLDEALNLIKNYQNVWGDLSAVPYLVTNENSTNAIRKVNSHFDKILFGSDYPVTTSGVIVGMKSNISSIMNSQYLTTDELNSIFYYNAKKLLFL